VDRAALIDGYLDEPSCLGVPPYISPAVRYTYGALRLGGLRAGDIDYLTADQLRADWDGQVAHLQSYSLVLVVAGTTVPGKYLGGRPLSLAEMSRLAGALPGPSTLLGGPVVLGALQPQGFDIVAGEIAAQAAYERLTGESIPCSLVDFIDRCAVLGAELTTRHPNFPRLVCELETYRGCPRERGCAFCGERLKKVRYTRSPAAVVREVEALALLGNTYFRLGCQPDLISYGVRPGDGGGIPRPDVIERLYSGIREAAPRLKVLHADNADPHVIAGHPGEASDILRIITRHNTPGDILAFGLESADPAVLAANNIGTIPRETLRAVELINQVGGGREDGVPRLLPGLNLIYGLRGETSDTAGRNLAFLEDILDRGLMLRRINIRQVIPVVPGYRPQPVNRYHLERHKQEVNEKINRAMLRRVFPTGTVLREVILEKQEGSVSFGRQLGTYPILVGVPGLLEVGSACDVVVVDHGYRSLTALPYPFSLNRAIARGQRTQLEALPGVGRRRATRLLMAGNIRDRSHLSQVLGSDYDLSQLEPWLTGDLSRRSGH